MLGSVHAATVYISCLFTARKFERPREDLTVAAEPDAARSCSSPPTDSWSSAFHSYIALLLLLGIIMIMRRERRRRRRRRAGISIHVSGIDSRKKSRE